MNPDRRIVARGVTALVIVVKDRRLGIARDDCRIDVRAGPRRRVDQRR